MEIKNYYEKSEKELNGNNTGTTPAVETNENSYNARPDDGVIATREEVVGALDTAYKAQDHFHQRLLYFTLKWVRIYFHCSMIREMTAEDVVQTALIKILSMERKWKKNQFPDIGDFVRFVLISFIRNERKRKGEIVFDDVFDGEDEDRERSFEDPVDYVFNGALTDSYCRDNFEDLYAKCEDRLKDDIYASFVFEERMRGVKSNMAIAKSLQIEVKDVEKAMKRIKRKLREVFFR